MRVGCVQQVRSQLDPIILWLVTAHTYTYTYILLCTRMQLPTGDSHSAGGKVFPSPPPMRQDIVDTEEITLLTDRAPTAPSRFMKVSESKLCFQC